MIAWLRSNRLEVIGLVFLVVIALGLRFYNLEGYMTFLGDEGRDALIVKDMLLTHHLRLLGPPMSFGNVYLGPLYYYMMAIAMAIFWLNPAAAAGMVGIIGVLTVFLIYYLARSWFGQVPAFVAAVLYAISPVTIIYSRSSWNPNPAPFFGLLFILGFFKAHISHNYLWLALAGGAAAAAIQMHYTALALIPTAAVLWLIELFKTKNKQNFGYGSIFGVVIFLWVMSPLIIFDLNHDFLNYRAIMNIFFSSDSGVNHSFLNSLAKVWPIYDQKLISRYLTGNNLVVAMAVAILVLIPVMVTRFKKWSYRTVFIWLGFGVLSLSFYNQDIFDHYLGSINPAPYLLIAGGLALISRKYWRWGMAILILVGLAFLNLEHNPLKYPPNNQLQKTQQIDEYIISKLSNQPFNFALLSAHNYDAAYQYYFDIYGHSALPVPSNITDQLWVVCEDPVCSPINNPKYEIAAFGWSKVAEQNQILGVTIFKLIHNN